MGQAKQRGDYEARKEIAVAHREAIIEDGARRIVGRNKTLSKKAAQQAVTSLILSALMSQRR